MGKQLKFDMDSFARDLKTKRTIENKIDLRKLGMDMSASPATISNIENKLTKTPDLITYAKICAWLKKPMETYLKTKK